MCAHVSSLRAREQAEDAAHEGENYEVRRLLRMPRYFDDDFELAALRCFRCGGGRGGGRALHFYFFARSALNSILLASSVVHTLCEWTLSVCGQPLQCTPRVSVHHATDHPRRRSETGCVKLAKRKE